MTQTAADDRHDTTHESHAGELAKLIPAVVLIAVLVMFGVANLQETEVDLLVTTTEAPLVAVLAATAVIGALIASLLRFRRHHH